MWIESGEVIVVGSFDVLVFGGVEVGLVDVVVDVL